MKVLHLPRNTASQTSVMVRALRDIGVDARGLVLGRSRYHDARGLELFPSFAPGRAALLRVRRATKWSWALGKAISWADVVHWRWGVPSLPFDLDLRYVALLGKARLIDFCGSDVRIPEIARQLVGIYERLLRNNRR